MNAPAVSVKTFSQVKNSFSASLSWLENKARQSIIINVDAHIMQFIITAHLNVGFTTATGTVAGDAGAIWPPGGAFLVAICYRYV
jgi:hypothetical protein